MNGLPAEADVIVIGAGPTGLALSAELRRRGCVPLTIERSSEPAQHSRAAVVHARTLEVLDVLGATPELLRRGIQVPIFRVRDGDRALITIDFRAIASRYPFTLMCPQDETEAVLRDCLGKFGGSVTKPVEVVAVRPVSDGVEVEVKGPQADRSSRHAMSSVATADKALCGGKRAFLSMVALTKKGSSLRMSG